MAFSPNSITVKKGTTVTWTNNDSTTHTVQETDGKSGPKSDNIAPGGTYTFTFVAAGSFAYHCSIHPSMTGTVTVTE
jgi:plastocyanin